MNKTQINVPVKKHLAGLYRASAILMVLGGIGGIILSRLSGMLYASGVPNDATGYLQLFSQHQMLAATDWSLWIAVDVTIVIPSIGLFFVLRKVNRNVALAGSVISVVYVVFDIVVTELNSLKLVSLSQSYVAAASSTVRSSVVAQATTIVNALPLMTFFSYTIGAVGWILWSVLMPKTFFRKTIAIFGVVVNIMGFLGGVANYAPALGIFAVFGALLTEVWFVVVGIKLLRNYRFADSGNVQSPELSKI